MYATVEKVKIGKKEIVCKDLTYGYLLGLSSGEVEETMHGVVMNSTGLSQEEIFDMRDSEVKKLYKVATRLTYPDLYDKDGNLKKTDKKSDKKKD